MVHIAIYISYAPLVQCQFRTLIIQIVVGRTLSRPFHRTGSTLVLHHQLGILGTTRSSTSVNSDNHWQRSLYRLHTTVDDTLDGCFTILNRKNLLSVCNLVEAQLLSHLRTYLSGITVDSLTTTNHDVYIANLLDGSSQRIRGSKGIGTSEETVGQQPARISATIKSLTDNFTCTRRTHREDSYC